MGDLMKLTIMTKTAIAAAMAMVALPSVASEIDAKNLLKQKCGTCHYVEKTDSYERIFDARRTPEGWQMTLLRMQRNHGVKINNNERLALIDYLSEEQGLSVAETKGYRYILERDPVSVDVGIDQEMTEMCSRCHSYARVALQRRTEEDWMKLVNFHLAQFVTAEYQALARDRDWFGIATTSVVKKLAENYPLGEAPAKTTAAFVGDWILAGHSPGRGDFNGAMAVSKGENGRYNVTSTMNFANGEVMTHSGTGKVYGDGEWRATLKGTDITSRQVMALAKDGVSLSGRWYKKGQDNVGGQLNAVRADASARVIQISPSYIKPGESKRLVMTGVGMSGDVSLGSGMTAKIVEQTANSVVMDVTADASATLGARTVSVGKATHADSLVVFDAVDHVKVSPDVEIARVGGGAIPKVPAQFEAIAYMDGADGKAGTEDDVKIGVMPANWSVDNFDEGAAAFEDAKFAGTIDNTGQFTPNLGGPNPKRIMTANNAGNLAVTAHVKDGDKVVEGKAQLYVTVQRFVDAQIR